MAGKSDTQKGLLRAIGADTIGGPVDAVWNALRSLQLPDGKTRELGARLGLMPPTAPVLPQDNPDVVGSSEWIAKLTGVQGDSPEYNAARLGGNLGLMALPWAAGKVRDFNPRPGQLNMWLGPLAKDYDAEKAAKVSKLYDRFMQRRGRKMPLSGADVDDFNRLNFPKRQMIVEPASKKVLQYAQDTVPNLDEGAFVKLHEGSPSFLKELWQDPNLEQYPGLGRTMVEQTTDPRFAGAFTRDPSVKGKAGPFTEGTMELNTEQVMGTALPSREGMQWLAHETGHSVQASENLPTGGNAGMMRDLGRVLKDYYGQAKDVIPDPTLGTPSAEIWRGRMAGANRAVLSPDYSYNALVGERLSQSAEHHTASPAEIVGDLQHLRRSSALPTFDNSLVLEAGHINPIRLYTQGLVPPYSGRGGMEGPTLRQGQQGLLSPELLQLLGKVPPKP